MLMESRSKRVKRNHPRYKNGLSLLRRIVLNKVVFTTEGNPIDQIFSNCLQLEELELKNIHGLYYWKVPASKHKRFQVLKVENCLDMYQLDVNAPNLSSFYYHGHVLIIHFLGTTSKLNDVVTTFIQPRIIQKPFTSQYFIKDVYNIRFLAINTVLLEGLCMKVAAGELREAGFKLPNLTEFQLFLDSPSYCTPYDIAAFAKNCPLVEKILIDLGKCSFECGIYWEFHLHEKFLQCKHSFEHLRRLMVKGYKSQKYEVEMVRYFLMRAKSLEMVTLVRPKNYYNLGRTYTPGEMNFQMYMYPWRASPRTNIVVSDYAKDMDVISPKHGMY